MGVTWVVVADFGTLGKVEDPQYLTEGREFSPKLGKALLFDSKPEADAAAEDTGPGGFAMPLVCAEMFFDYSEPR